MNLWFVFALMTVAAIFAVLWPLGRRTASQTGGTEATVYRDQLAEIDRDLAGGLIGASEAACVTHEGREEPPAQSPSDWSRYLSGARLFTAFRSCGRVRSASRGWAPRHIYNASYG